MKKLFLFLLILGIFISVSAFGADVTTFIFGVIQTLPKTGQTTSYQDYDDGYYEKGSASTPRFVDNGDGTISDRITGLMWVKQPELIIPGATGVHSSNQIQAAKGDWATETSYSAADLVKDTVDSTYWVSAVTHTSGTGTFAEDRTAYPTYWRQTVWTASAANLTTPSTKNWTTSITNFEALEYAGYTDWYLPNVKQLVSIVNYQNSSPSIDTTYFPNTKTFKYWTGTTFKLSTGSAWYVYFGSAGMSDFGYVSTTSKSNSDQYVRPVRSR